MKRASRASLLLDGEVPDQEALGVEKLVVGRWRLGDPAELLQHPALRLLELLRGRRDVGGEEAHGDSLDVERAHRVGEALPVAKLAEEAAALSAQDLSDHLQDLAILVLDRETAEPDHQVSLGAILVLLGDADLARSRLHLGHGGVERLAVEGTEPAGQMGRHVVRIHVADHGDHQIVRTREPLVVGDQVLAADLTHGIGCPRDRESVGVSAEVGLAEEIEDPHCEPVVAPCDHRQGVAALSFDLLGAKRRREHHLGKQVEGWQQLLAGRVQGQTDAVPPGEAIDVGRQRLHLPREVGGGARSGSAHPHSRQEVADPGGLCGLGEQPSEHRRTNRHHRDLAPRDHVDLDAVLQLVRENPRESFAGPGAVECAGSLADPAGHGLLDGGRVEAGLRAVGQHRAHRESLWRQPLLRHALQILGGGCPDPLEILRFAAVIPGDQLKASDLPRQSGDTLVLPVLAGQEVCPRLLELVVGNGFGAQHLGLPQDRFHRSQSIGWVEIGHRPEQTGIQGRVGGGVDPVDEAELLLHALHQPAALAFAENEGEQIEQRCIGMAEFDGAPGEVETGALERTPQECRPQGGLLRLGRPVPEGLAGLRVCEEGADLLENTGTLEVSDRHHHESVGCVPAMVEAGELLVGEGRDLLPGAEDRGSIGVNLVGRPEERIREHVVGIVLGGADLLQDDLDLAIDLLGIEDRALDRVRQHLEPHAHLGAGKRCVVAGHVEGGIGVDASAHALHRSRDLTDPPALGALEEHVFVKVCEPSLARPFVGGSDRGPDLDLGHGRYVDLTQQHGQPVRECFELNRRRTQGSGRVPFRGARPHRWRLRPRSILRAGLSVLRFRGRSLSSSHQRGGGSLPGRAARRTSPPARRLRGPLPREPLFRGRYAFPAAAELDRSNHRSRR